MSRPTGWKHTEEARKKISESKKGKRHISPSEETKRKISKANKGKHCTEETKKKISQTLANKKRKPLSEEHKKKISETNKLKVGPLNSNWKGGISKDRNHYDYERRALERGTLGSHTLGEWETLKVQYGFTCPCCRQSEPEIKLTEDHIIPLSKGGSNYIENIQPLCKSCNSKKHTKIINYKEEMITSV